MQANALAPRMHPAGPPVARTEKERGHGAGRAEPGRRGETAERSVPLVLGDLRRGQRPSRGEQLGRRVGRVRLASRGTRGRREASGGAAGHRIAPAPRGAVRLARPADRPGAGPARGLRVDGKLPASGQRLVLHTHTTRACLGARRRSRAARRKACDGCTSS